MVRPPPLKNRGDVEIPGGTFLLGSEPKNHFVFDNEKWAHPKEVKPFKIARDAVTQEEFAWFVKEDGYTRKEFWTEQGWLWREAEQAKHPLYWRRGAGGQFERRLFDTWIPLEPTLPMLHVNWYEAEAYCRFAGRRLPTELEWEVAAAGEADAKGRTLAPKKRRYPWGDTFPTPDHAHLEGLSIACADVPAHKAGDSAFSCRQMLGNVWEWTQDDFLPYPGFSPDPYQEYSQPWFQTHKVLRGGCFVTRARLVHNMWRNFYTPDRRDVWAGFRTCAL
jgi:iron(II)-dependent oxidoreductase